MSDEMSELDWLDKHGIGKFGRDLVCGVSEPDGGIIEFYLRFDCLGTKVYVDTREELMVEWLKLGDQIFG